MSEYLVTVSPPGDALWSNCVYVNPGETTLCPDPNALTGQFIKVGPAIFTVRADERIKMKQIGFNKWQRESAIVVESQLVEPQVVNGPSDDDVGLFKVHIKVFLLKKIRTTLKEKEVCDKFKTVFNKQHFIKGQVVGQKQDGSLLGFNITHCFDYLKDEKTGSVSINGAPVNGGFITSTTQFELDFDKKDRLLTVEVAKKKRGVLRADWKFSNMGIGGLDHEFSEILTRAFASRLWPKRVCAEMGVRHVKGLLLYGPPGTGKTLIARQISKMIDPDGPEPKICNGPEILDKYVGESERKLRELFADAEEEFKEAGDDSHLHVIIFDEIDAICKQRGSTRGGTGVHDTVVNQILSKMDGVDQLHNILVIGMTNRKDMIDEALLRPGRLEVHMPIGLPDEEGRAQIFAIKTKVMAESGRLADDVKMSRLAQMSENYSGAEIDGVVAAAVSAAMKPTLDRSGGGIGFNEQMAKTIQIKHEHFKEALTQVKAAFGSSEALMQSFCPRKWVDWGPELTATCNTIESYISQVKGENTMTPLISICLDGPHGVGKTAIAAKLAMDSKIPYVKMISPDMFIGDSESAKCHRIEKIFLDAYRSDISMIILDDIERLLEFVKAGPRFSNLTLQTLLILMKKAPPREMDGPDDTDPIQRKMIIVATSSALSELDAALDFGHAFSVTTHIPSLSDGKHIEEMLSQLNIEVDKADLQEIIDCVPYPIVVKDFLLVAEMARQGGNTINASSFKHCLQATGVLKRNRFP